MDVRDAVRKRISVRAFEEKPVPRKVMEEIMSDALWAPSWGNTQPWKLTLVAGETLKKIQEEFVDLFVKGVPSTPDYPMPGDFPPDQKFRYQNLGRGLFTALGIGREEQEKRGAYYLDMMRGFGVSQMIYLQLEKGFNPYALMDAGIILQTIALLAMDRGLGTCFLAQSVRYPDVIRRHTGIPESQVLILGMAIGYPAADHPANRFRSRREGMENLIRFLQ